MRRRRAARGLLIINPQGACLTSAPLHDGCTRTAAALCPAPAKVNARIVTATRTQITTRGDIAVELGMVQTWRLDFRPASGSSEPTLRSAPRNAARRTPHAAEVGTGEQERP